MKKAYVVSWAFIFLFSYRGAYALSVRIDVDTNQEKGSISSYLYGTNFDIEGYVNPTLRVFGGNRTTTYNWENNASNAGSDWQNFSDDYLAQKVGVPVLDRNKPGSVLKTFHDRSRGQNAKSIMALPMAGYVARDTSGQVTQDQQAPSNRWVEINSNKGGLLSLSPDANDNYVYADEEVNFLVQQYGKGSEGGVTGYLLDNEPTLWRSTHPLVHPSITTCSEVITKSTQLAKAVKAVDSTSSIFGPVSYGFDGYRFLQTGGVPAPDWNEINRDNRYNWFLDYYLEQLKKESDNAGKRLLDFLTLHWYTEARGDGKRVVQEGVCGDNMECNKALVRSPRIFWDANYTEDSWIFNNALKTAEERAKFFPLLPRLQESIDRYFPGTEIAFSEFSYGNDSIYGAIATADTLGVFGKFGVSVSAYWKTNQEETSRYISAAYRVFRDYDGNKSAFESTRIKTATTHTEETSVYGSISANEKELHLIIINKDFTNSADASINITSNTLYKSGEVWCFDKDSSEITLRGQLTGIGNSFTYTMPALSVCHMAFSGIPPTKLREGWNFIALPSLNEEGAAILKESLQVGWGYDNQNKKWIKYPPNQGLPPFGPNSGYWLYLRQPVTLFMESAPGEELTLYEGWNLMGYNGISGKKVEEALEPVGGKWDIVWGWDNGTWRVAVPPLRFLSIPIEPLAEFDRGNACWIKTNVPVLTVTWQP